MSRAFMIKQAPFKPTDIGGCILWLDGADPAGNGIAPVNGSSISTWVDKSTGGYNMIQGTGSLQPIYNIYSSYPGLYFNGSQYLANASLIQSGTGGRTTFFVFKDVNTNGTVAYDAGLLVMNLTSYNPGQGWSISLNGSSNILGVDTYGAAYIAYSNSTPVTNMRNSLTIGMVQVQSSGTVGNIVSYGNGTLFDTIVSSGLTSSAVNTGGVNTAIGALPGFWYTNAYIYEILHYNLSISSPQRQQVEAYLAQKWGLRQQLPQGHPGTRGIVYPSQPIPTAIYWKYDTNPAGISRPANVLPIPPITLYASARPTTYVTGGLLFFLDAGNAASYPGTGSTWADLAGSGLTTTLYGSPTYSSANGGYISFSPGNGHYGQTSASLATLSSWSLEVWHYYTATNTGGAPCILTEVWNSTPINFTLGAATSTAALQAGYFNGGWYTTTVSYSLPSVGWYHIVGTYDGTNLKLYVNNVLTQTSSSTTASVSSALGIRFMRRWDLGDYWGGYLAIVRIYNRALSATEVATNYSGNKARFGLS